MENNDFDEMRVVTLPTLTPQALMEFSTPDNMVEASDLWYMMMNDNLADAEVDKLYPMSTSRYSLFKELSILGMKPSTDGSKKKATKENVALMLSQSTYGRVGGLIRLVHSGFSVKLKTITGVERTDLQHNIAENVIALHRELTGDIYTGIYVNIYENILDLFISKIEYTTLDLSIKANIRKYIRVKDLGLILLGLLDMMYPGGYDFNYICGEFVGEDDNKTICGNKSDVYKIRMKELLYLSDELTENEYSQLFKDERNSISVDEVKKYQENFKYNKAASFTLDGNTFHIEPGTVDVFLDKSKEWLKSNIVESSLFTNNTDIVVLQNLINTSKIGLYYYAISGLENESYVANRESITLEHINILSSREDFISVFVEASKRSLLYSFYQLGIPKFVCKSCTERLNSQTEENNTESEDGETVDNLNITSEKNEDSKDIFTNLNLLDLFSYLV